MAMGVCSCAYGEGNVRVLPWPSGRRRHSFCRGASSVRCGPKTPALPEPSRNPGSAPVTGLVGRPGQGPGNPDSEGEGCARSFPHPFYTGERLSPCRAGSSNPTQQQLPQRLYAFHFFPRFTPSFPLSAFHPSFPRFTPSFPLSLPRSTPSLHPSPFPLPQ